MTEKKMKTFALVVLDKCMKAPVFKADFDSQRVRNSFYTFDIEGMKKIHLASMKLDLDILVGAQVFSFFKVKYTILFLW